MESGALIGALCALAENDRTCPTCGSAYRWQELPSLIRAILHGRGVTVTEDFAVVLREHFQPDHKVWSFVRGEVSR